jgi:glycine cleavage system protein P-like pyridoxal-binding family
MKNVRKRFTIPEDQLLLAEEYAKATNRTLSELVVECLFQIRHRHRQKDEKKAKNRLEDRVHVLEEIIAQKEWQPHYRAGSEGVRD